MFFQDYDLSVSVGSLDSGFLVETEPFINYVITSSNYKNFTSELFKLSFKLDSYVGTPCIILHMSPKASSVDYQRGFYIKDIQLLSNSSATEEKLDGVLGWLQELWNSITEGFSNLAADFTQGINNTISELQVTWQQITSKIEQIKDNLVGEIQASWQQTVMKMTSMVESISGFFDNLGASFERLINKLINYLLYFDDEVPDNPFKSEDSVLSDLHSFIDNIVISIEMFSNDIEDVIDSISASAQIFTDFVESNDWLWIIVIVVLGFIVVSRFIGL